ALPAFPSRRSSVLIPLRSVLLVMITSELPPKRSIVLLFVDPVLTLPLIAAVVTLMSAMLSGVGVTSSLLVMARLEEGATTSTEVLVSALNWFLFLVAWQRTT